MLYQLLIKLNCIFDKIILFITFLPYLHLWKKSLFTKKKKQVNALCIYDRQHQHIKQAMEQRYRDTEIIYCELDNCNNTQICERVYTLCNKLQPTSLFVFFTNIYHDNGSYLHTAKIKCEESTHSDIYYATHFLRFVNNFLLIKMICKCNGIHMNWYIPQNIITMINRKQNYELFNDDSTCKYLQHI